MLDICGIREEQMPKLYESYEAVGTLTKDMAQILGPDEVIDQMVNHVKSVMTLYQ